MKRIIFKLLLPGTGGIGNFFRVVRVSDKAAKDLSEKSWCHKFDDGTRLFMSAEIAPYMKRLPKSDGFCGSEWAVDSIVKHGVIVYEA